MVYIRLNWVNKSVFVLYRETEKENLVYNYYYYFCMQVSLFTALPVNPDEYYLVGQYALNIPGIDDYPGLPTQIEIAAAINFCQGDYVFAFNGLEITPKLNNMVGKAELSTAAFSYYFQLNTADLGINTNFWTPYASSFLGTQDLFLWGDVALTGDVSFGITFNDAVYIEINDASSMLINSDPFGGGFFTPDFATGRLLSLHLLCFIFDLSIFLFNLI